MSHQNHNRNHNTYQSAINYIIHQQYDNNRKVNKNSTGKQIRAF